MTTRPSFLPTVVRLDALASGTAGLAALLGAPVLAELLGIPRPLLWALGAVLIGWAAWLWFGVARPEAPRRGVREVIALNGLWIVASALLVLSGWLPLTLLGTALVIVQALVVALFFDLQVIGLRDARFTASESV